MVRHTMAIMAIITAFIFSIGVVMASTANAITEEEILLIRDHLENDDVIAFVVETTRNDVIFHDGYFLINGIPLHAHTEDITSISDSDKQISILGKTVSNDQFVLFYDKTKNTVSYEFWIDKKQYRDTTPARTDKL